MGDTAVRERGRADSDSQVLRGESFARSGLRWSKSVVASREGTTGERSFNITSESWYMDQAQSRLGV